MAITAINTANQTNTTDIKKMPVFVLISMTPIALNSETPKHTVLEAGNAHRIELKEAKPERPETPTYILPQSQQNKLRSNGPFGFELLERYMDVLYTHKFKAHGMNYTMVFAKYNGEPKDKVNEVFIIPADTHGGKGHEHPPEIITLKYHNIGKDKEFLGAIIKQEIYDPKTGEYDNDHYARYEMRLDDETAQKLIDLKTRHSQFKDGTPFRIEETTNPTIEPMQIREEFHVFKNYK